MDRKLGLLICLSYKKLREEISLKYKELVNLIILIKVENVIEKRLKK